MDNLLIQMPIIALSMIRPMGMLLLLPLFSGNILGGSLTRNAIILTLALPVVPTLQHMHSTLAEGDISTLLLLYGKEMLVGLLFSFCAAVPFWAVDIAGFIIDTMRGAAIATIFNPLLNLQSSVYGTLFTQVLSVLYLVSGGFNDLIAALYQSYQQLPPGFSLTWSPGIIHFIEGQWSLMNQLALSFVIPSMLVMIVTDIALGLINRSAQQLNVFFLSMPIKSVLVLLFMIYGLYQALTHYLEQIIRVEHQLSTLLSMLAGG
ncbi:MAG: type III secretion system export apparatus subunit SctT [Enterobacteriaceae bacterium]